MVVATFHSLTWKSLVSQGQRKKNPALPNVWPLGHREDTVPRHQKSQRTISQLPKNQERKRETARAMIEKEHQTTSSAFLDFFNSANKVSDNQACL